MPPSALISSSARSKPFFHWAPYWAYWPVSGPQTPINTGSALCARRRDGTASTLRVAAPAVRKVRRGKVVLWFSLTLILLCYAALSCIHLRLSSSQVFEETA